MQQDLSEDALLNLDSDDQAKQQQIEKNSQLIESEVKEDDTS